MKQSTITSLFLIPALTFSLAASLIAQEDLPDLRISEFMAENDSTLLDADGDAEDWIEIQNAGLTTIDLSGYYLTDDPAILNKWAIPANTELTAGSQLVIFASSKDRTEDINDLHTNFNLETNGEYLALVRPDGITIQHDYPGTYPNQRADVSFGIGNNSSTEPITLISPGADCTWHVPLSDIGSDWQQPTFDDASWNAGKTGIGYGYAGLVGDGGDVRSEMQVVNGSVYIRVPFEVANPGRIAWMSLNMKYEDGIAVYLNGEPVASHQTPSPLLWNSIATMRRLDSDAEQYATFDLDFAGHLRVGENILAIHGLNETIGSSDVLFLPELIVGSIVGESVGIGYFLEPTPGGLNGSKVDGFVRDTSFDFDRGFYDEPFSLTITTETPNAQIRYTTDGSPPNEETGTVYTGPIPISETTVVRAAAFRSGWVPTNVDTQTYIFPADIYGPDMVDALTAVPTISLVAQANYDLRLMSVATTGDLPDDPEESVVIVALVGGALHVRIIDVHIRRSQETNRFERQIVVDKGEAELVGGQILADLKSLVREIPDESALSPETRRGVVDKAISISGHTPRPPFLTDNNNDYIEHKSSIEMIFPDGRPGFQEEGGLTNFGGGFTNFEKKSFRVYFRSEYGTTKLRYPIFDDFDYPSFPPADEFDAINLRTGSHDMVNRGAYMASRFVDDTMLEMGQIAPHGRFVHVYLNGRYWGQYHLRERWNAEMGSSYFGGSKEDYDAISANNSGMNFQTGVPYDGTAAFWTETGNRLRGPDPFVNAAGHIDIANVIDFMLLWTAGECESEFRAFGSQALGVPFKFMVRDPDGYMPTSGWGHAHPVTHQGPISAMTELRSGGNSDYDIFLADRIHKHFFNDGALTAEKSVERLRKRFEEARPGFAAEARRWNYRSVSNWETEVNRWINTGLPQRTPSMIQKLRQAGMYPDIEAPEFSQHGGTLPANGNVLVTADGLIYYTTDGSDPRLPGGAINPSATRIDGRGLETIHVEAGSEWKYLDDGSDQGTAWREPGYNDAGWASGPAQFGYTEGDEATLISFGPNSADKHITTYFRKTFEAGPTANLLELNFGVLRDDGAVVYINGTEVLRTNMPNGVINFETTASSSESGDDEDTFFPFTVSPDPIVEGTNTIAVELHQASATNSDTSFDLTFSSLASQGTPTVHFDGPGTLKARVFDSGEWSALNEAFFIPGSVPASADNLVVGEIMYHPSAPTIAEMNAGHLDRDLFEFIELRNISNSAVNLVGVKFTDGIAYTFGEENDSFLPAGASILLVSNREAFNFRYSEFLPVAGAYVGNLRNSGEMLELQGDTGEVIKRFAFNDRPPWPLSPDGMGTSLVLRNPTANPDHALAQNWTASSVEGGTPGSGADGVGYDLWLTQFFSPGQIATPAITGPNTDGDNDGRTLFLEFGLGFHPLESEAGPAFEVTTTASGEVIVTHARSKTASGLNYILEYSEDFSTWLTDAKGDRFTLVSIEEQSADADALSYRYNPAKGEEGARYFRLRVEE